MKIGVLTWYFGANYGAQAQAYALQQVITSLGAECVMINYHPPTYKKVNIAVSMNYKHLKRHPILAISCLVRCYNFSKGNKRYNQSVSVCNGEQIDELGVDCIVFGSDAIFNVLHKMYTDLYMGVGINKKRKVAYAPSCEDLPADYKLKADCIESIKQFSHVAVRDKNTKKLIEFNTGVDAEIVLDPTLLYDFQEITSLWREKNYILIYSFSDWDIYKTELQQFACSRKLRIIAVGRYCAWADRSYNAASFEKWICSFRNAAYVFTDSFHGTVFAIKNEKEIILCGRKDKEEKIKSLLCDAGISRRFYNGEESIEHYLENSPIDYREVRNNISECIEHSKTFLKNSLGL